MFELEIVAGIDEAVVQELSAKQEVDENAIKVAQQTGEVTETTPDGDGDAEPGANNRSATLIDWILFLFCLA